MVFSYCLLRSIRERQGEEEEGDKLEDYEWKFVMVGYVVPFLMSMVPFFDSNRFATQTRTRILPITAG